MDQFMFKVWLSFSIWRGVSRSPRASFNSGINLVVANPVQIKSFSHALPWDAGARGGTPL